MDNYKDKSNKLECCKNCIYSDGKHLCSVHLRMQEFETMNGICDLYDKCEDYIAEHREETTDEFFSYHIPKKYLDMMDDKFKCLFIKKMFLYDINSFEPEVFGEYDEETDTYNEDKEEIYFYTEPYQDLPICWFNELEGTGLWNDIIESTCKELHKEELYDYYRHLEWYNSDLFDNELSVIITKKLYREDKTKSIKKEV